jgi:hypothetical protein
MLKITKKTRYLNIINVWAIRKIPKERTSGIVGIIFNKKIEKCKNYKNYYMQLIKFMLKNKFDAISEVFTAGTLSMWLSQHRTTTTEQRLITINSY